MSDRNNSQVKGFAVGEHVTLRPVLEEDLEQLARLMANNPGEPDRQPWTTQRLKKKFEDEKEPGLWGRSMRMFTALDNGTGGIAGYLKEQKDENPGVFWCYMHLAEDLENRDALGKDLVSAYLAYKQRWHDPLRIGFDALDSEDDKAAWFEACGFPHELTRKRMVMWLGQPTGISTYAWYSERLKAELAKREE